MRLIDFLVSQVTNNQAEAESEEAVQAGVGSDSATDGEPVGASPPEPPQETAVNSQASDPPSPPGEPTAKASPPVGSAQGLTMDDVRAMDSAQINSRWDEVSKVLGDSR